MFKIMIDDKKMIAWFKEGIDVIGANAEIAHVIVEDEFGLTMTAIDSDKTQLQKLTISESDAHEFVTEERGIIERIDIKIADIIAALRRLKTGDRIYLVGDMTENEFEVALVNASERVFSIETTDQDNVPIVNMPAIDFGAKIKMPASILKNALDDIKFTQKSKEFDIFVTPSSMSICGKNEEGKKYNGNYVFTEEDSWVVNGDKTSKFDLEYVQGFFRKIKSEKVEICLDNGKPLQTTVEAPEAMASSYVTITAPLSIRAEENASVLEEETTEPTPEVPEQIVETVPEAVSPTSGFMPGALPGAIPRIIASMAPSEETERDVETRDNNNSELTQPVEDSGENDDWNVRIVPGRNSERPGRTARRGAFGDLEW